MATNGTPSLSEVMEALKHIEQGQQELLSAVEGLAHRPASPSSPRQLLASSLPRSAASRLVDESDNELTAASSSAALASQPSATPPLVPADAATATPSGSTPPAVQSGFTSRIILTYV